MYKQLSPTAPFQPAPPAAIIVFTPLPWDLPFHQALVASWGPGKEVSSSDTDPRSIAEDYWVHQQSCWHLQVCTLEEGQEKPDQREKETKGVRSSRGNTKISRGGKAPFRSCMLQPMENNTRPDGYAWWNCSQWRASTGAEENHEEETATAERNSCVLTTLYSPPWCFNRVGELGEKEWSWAWEKWEERCGSIICLFCFN